MNPKLVGVFQALGLAILLTICGFLADASNLSGLFNPYTATIISAIALAIEQDIQSKTGKSLLGSVHTT